MKKKRLSIFKNSKGFSLLELVVVITIMAILVAVMAPSYLNKIEASRRNKDLYNADLIRRSLDLSLADGSIVFNDDDSAVWVYVTKKNAYFYSNGVSSFPTIDGVTGNASIDEFKKLMLKFNIDSSIRVECKTFKDTGTVGSDEGWQWYCVYLYSKDKQAKIVSGPGYGGENYLNNYTGSTGFKICILNYKDSHLSAMPRAINGK